MDIQKLRETLLEWRENALRKATSDPSLLARYGALGRADGYENAIHEIDRILTENHESRDRVFYNQVTGERISLHPKNDSNAILALESQSAWVELAFNEKP